MYWNGVLCKIKLSERVRGSMVLILHHHQYNQKGASLLSFPPPPTWLGISGGTDEKLVIRHHWEENKLSAVYLLFIL